MRFEASEDSLKIVKLLFFSKTQQQDRENAQSWNEEGRKRWNIVDVEGNMRQCPYFFRLRFFLSRFLFSKRRTTAENVFFLTRNGFFVHELRPSPWHHHHRYRLSATAKASCKRRQTRWQQHTALHTAEGKRSRTIMAMVPPYPI